MGGRANVEALPPFKARPMNEVVLFSLRGVLMSSGWHAPRPQSLVASANGHQTEALGESSSGKKKRHENVGGAYVLRRTNRKTRLAWAMRISLSLAATHSGSSFDLASISCSICARKPGKGQVNEHPEQQIELRPRHVHLRVCRKAQQAKHHRPSPRNQKDEYPGTLPPRSDIVHSYKVPLREVPIHRSTHARTK